MNGNLCWVHAGFVFIGTVDQLNAFTRERNIDLTFVKEGKLEHQAEAKPEPVAVKHNGNAGRQKGALIYAETKGHTGKRNTGKKVSWFHKAGFTLRSKIRAMFKNGDGNTREGILAYLMEATDHVDGISKTRRRNLLWHAIVCYCNPILKRRLVEQQKLNAVV